MNDLQFIAARRDEKRACSNVLRDVHFDAHVIEMSR